MEARLTRTSPRLSVILHVGDLGRCQSREWKVTGAKQSEMQLLRCHPRRGGAVTLQLLSGIRAPEADCSHTLYGRLIKSSVHQGGPSVCHRCPPGDRRLLRSLFGGAFTALFTCFLPPTHYITPWQALSPRHLLDVLNASLCGLRSFFLILGNSLL